MNALAIQPLPQQEMRVLAERAAELGEAINVRGVIFNASDEPSTSIDRPCLSSRLAYGVRQFGLIATAASLIGATSASAEDVSTQPAVGLDTVRELAIAKQIAHDIPTVAHVWTKQSFRIRQAARQFGESTNADY